MRLPFSTRFGFRIKVGKYRGNSMGLILEARSPIYSLPSPVCCFGFQCFAFLFTAVVMTVMTQEHQSETAGSSSRMGQTALYTLFHDDTRIIESST